MSNPTSSFEPAVGAGPPLEPLPQRASPETPRHSMAALLVLGASSLLLFVACLLWPNPGGFWGPLATLVMAWVLFAVHVGSCGRRLSSFDPLLWIPVVMLLHYFGMPIAVEVMGLIDTYDAWKIGGPPRLTHGFAVALLTLSCLLFGIHLAGVNARHQRAKPIGPEEDSLLGPSMCLFVGGTVMMLIGIPIAGTALLTGSYGELKWAEVHAAADLRLFYSGIVFATSGIYGVVASHHTRTASYTVLACVGAIFFALVFLMVGDRWGVSVVAMSGGWVFTQRVLRTPRWPVVAGFIVALLFMPVIKEYREFKSVEERKNIPQLFAAVFYEMGSSLEVFCYTLEFVPERKFYSLGRSTVSQLIYQIPNLGLNPGLYLGLDPVEDNPGPWIVKMANPSKYEARHGGYGFAMGAEWYFNFGMPGVFLGMIASGWVLARVRNNALRSPMWLWSSALVFTMYSGLVRNSLSYPLRTVLWPLMGILLIRMLWPRSRVAAYTGQPPIEGRVSEPR